MENIFDDAADIINDIPVVFSLEQLEGFLFQSMHDLMIDAKHWARFLKYLIHNRTKSSSGTICETTWTTGSRFSLERFTRWIKVKVGDDTLVVVLGPHKYDGQVNYRFVVACTNENIIPTVMLFSDHILGEAY